MPTLKRLNDGKIVTGKGVTAIKWNKDKSFKEEAGKKPTLGCSVLLFNSITDHWLTTIVTEILEEKEGYVKFKTENSTYELHY